jgi:GR25 family glycosyltransferase involved in LPS biosynthesis
MADYPVVIIGALNSQRLDYFKRSREIMEALDPTFLNATILDSTTAGKLVSSNSIEYQKAMYGRRLLNPEMGCAMSHHSAQEIIANTSTGGLILEDDARINDLSSLIATTEKFLIDHRKESAILTFFDGRPWSAISSSFRNGHPYVRILGSTAYAVSYALTPKAAKALTVANHDFRYVPDWPITKCKYFSSTLNLISHGDSSTVSTIDPDGSQRPAGYTLWRRILVLSGLYHFTHWKTFGSFKVFLKDLWVPRLNFYIVEMKFKYLTLRYPVR